MEERPVSPEDLISSEEVASKFGICSQDQLKLIDTGRLAAYQRIAGRPIVNPTMSNRNYVPPGLAGPPQKYGQTEYNKITEDEKGGLGLKKLEQIYYISKEVEALIQEKKADGPGIKQATTAQPTHRSSTQRQIYKAAAERAKTIIYEHLHHNILPATIEKKMNTLLEDKKFQGIISSLGKVSKKTLIRRLREAQPDIWQIGKTPKNSIYQK